LLAGERVFVEGGEPCEFFAGTLEGPFQLLAVDGDGGDWVHLTAGGADEAAGDAGGAGSGDLKPPDAAAGFLVDHQVPAAIEILVGGEGERGREAEE